MARYEGSEPIEIMDRQLWRDAQQMLDRHAEADRDSRCEWCGWQWPCPPRRLAERAEAASRQAWRESWTARHDLNDLRTLPSWRAEQPDSPEPLPGPAMEHPEPEYAVGNSAGAGRHGPGWAPGAANRSGRTARHNQPASLPLPARSERDPAPDRRQLPHHRALATPRGASRHRSLPDPQPPRVTPAGVAGLPEGGPDQAPTSSAGGLFDWC